MRQIGTIPNEPQAERFGDYLLTLGIANTVEESPATNEWAVWVENDDHLAQATAELESFLANPADPRYVAAVKQAKVVRTQEAEAQNRRRKQFIDVRTRWSQARQWNVPLTLALIGISVLVAVLTGLGHRQSDAEDALRINGVHHITTSEGEGLLPRPYYESIKKDHEYWRLITPIFLHYGILHILFNMLWLRDLGGMIESVKGTWFLALLVIVIAVFSNCAQYALPAHSPFFGGMSGVVFGLFGYVWVKGKLDPGAGIGISRENAILMFIWLGLCMTGLVGAIANGAHVVGLLVGLAFAYVPYLVRRVLR